MWVCSSNLVDKPGFGRVLSSGFSDLGLGWARFWLNRFEVRFWWTNRGSSEFKAQPCQIRSTSKFIIFGFKPTLVSCKNTDRNSIFYFGTLRMAYIHVCIVCTEQLYISKCVKVFAYFIFSATNRTFKTSTLHTIVYYPKVRFQSYLMQFYVVIS